MAGGFEQAAVHFLHSYGYVALFVLLALETSMVLRSDRPVRSVPPERRLHGSSGVPERVVEQDGSVAVEDRLLPRLIPGNRIHAEHWAHSKRHP